MGGTCLMTAANVIIDILQPYLKKINNTYEAVEILLQLEKSDEKLRKIFINNIDEFISFLSLCKIELNQKLQR